MRPQKRRQQHGGEGIYLSEKNVHAGWAAVRAAEQCPHLPQLKRYFSGSGLPGLINLTRARFSASESS
jgi:hypothetical protein